MTIGSLRDNGFAELPTEKGIYIIKRPDDFEVKFSKDTIAISQYRGRSLLYDIKTLEDKYTNVQNKDILYIGKAGGKGGLKKRLLQYIKSGYKKYNNHRGGRAIWQIEKCDELIVDFYCCDNCEEEEKRLLKEYKEHNKTYPLANWRG